MRTKISSTKCILGISKLDFFRFNVNMKSCFFLSTDNKIQGLKSFPYYKDSKSQCSFLVMNGF